MTHTKHRKRRERADRERLRELPGFVELQKHLAAPLDPHDPWWGRTGRAG